MDYSSRGRTNWQLATKWHSSMEVLSYDDTKQAKQISENRHLTQPEMEEIVKAAYALPKRHHGCWKCRWKKTDQCRRCWKSGKKCRRRQKLECRECRPCLHNCKRRHKKKSGKRMKVKVVIVLLAHPGMDLCFQIS